MIEMIEIHKCDKCGKEVLKKQESPNPWFFDLNFSNGILNRLVIPFVIRHVNQLRPAEETQEGAILCKDCQKEILQKMLEALEE